MDDIQKLNQFIATKSKQHQEQLESTVDEEALDRVTLANMNCSITEGLERLRDCC